MNGRRILRAACVFALLSGAATAQFGDGSDGAPNVTSTVAAG